LQMGRRSHETRQLRGEITRLEGELGLAAQNK
jgi:hypothetical protein